MMDEGLVEALEVSNRISLYLLEAIEPAALVDRAGAKGRTVGAMFAHIHNARLMWLEEAGRELMDGLAKIPKEESGNQALLRSSLGASAAAMEALLKKGLATGKIKGFTRSMAAFIGYVIAHEAYHHGEIGIALSQSGHPLNQKVAYGMWEWGVR